MSNKKLLYILALLGCFMIICISCIVLGFLFARNSDFNFFDRRGGSDNTTTGRPIVSNPVSRPTPATSASSVATTPTTTAPTSKRYSYPEFGGFYFDYGNGITVTDAVIPEPGSTAPRLVDKKVTVTNSRGKKMTISMYDLPAGNLAGNPVILCTNRYSVMKTGTLSASADGEKAYSGGLVRLDMSGGEDRNDPYKLYDARSYYFVRNYSTRVGMYCSDATGGITRLKKVAGGAPIQGESGVGTPDDNDYFYILNVQVDQTQVLNSADLAEFEQILLTMSWMSLPTDIN